MPKVFQSNEKGYIPKNLTPNIQTKSLLKQYMYVSCLFSVSERNSVSIRMEDPLFENTSLAGGEKV